MSYEGSQVGPYTLIRLIGRGNFGEVWLAERRTELVTTQFAVKLPLGSAVDLATIKQEASIWAKVSGHPNVIPIIEANIYDGQIVIVSEYAPDGSLENWLRSNPVMSINQAVEMVLGILNGLEFLHARGIIHRDLKPENILLQGSIPRLADFGVSRAMKATNVSSQIMGTPVFMAPEAFDGKRDKQTDIWSVGVILHLLLARQLPFIAEQMSELIAGIIWREPRPLPMSIPTPLKDIVARALAKNPEKRYQTAEDMRRDLMRIAGSFSAATEALSDPAIATASLIGKVVATDPALIPTVASLPPPILQAGAIASQQTTISKAENSHRGFLLGAGILAVLLFIAGALTIGVYSISRVLPSAKAPATSSDSTDLLAPGKVKQLLSKLDSDNGVPLKMVWIVLYPHEFYVIVHDSKIDENYDRYTYRDGEFKKEPDSFDPKEYWDHREFSLSDVDFNVLPVVVKVAQEKAQGLEGGSLDTIDISRHPDSPKDKVGKIQWAVYIRGARKQLYLDFDEHGKNVKDDRLPS